MKNNADAIVFHINICVGASQILFMIIGLLAKPANNNLMADVKSYSRILHRPHRVNAPEWRVV